MQSPLTGSDVRSATWRRLSEWAKAEIEALRKHNDDLLLSIEKTTELRARIAQLNEMLSLAESASDGSTEPLAVFDSTETSSIEAAVGRH